MEALAAGLKTNGYVVLPRPAWFTDAKLGDVPRMFALTIAGMPEFKVLSGDQVCGGFSAFGNPSSFHNMAVRRFREYAQHEVIPFLDTFMSLHNMNGYLVEQLIDRMMVRKVGKRATAESWHRDETPNACDNDVILGGWWNLDTKAQYFSCVPKSHAAIRGNKGFAPISRDMHQTCREKSCKVYIPPGAIIIFYEHIIHEVVSEVVKHKDMHRLFMGWRLTLSSAPLYDVLPRLEAQAVMPLKSGQMPPMYPKLYWTNWRDKLVAFSKGFRNQCIETKTISGGVHKGKQYRVVHREMHSLKDYGLKMYPDYHASEADMHVPNASWNVRYGGTNETTALKLVLSCAPPPDS